MFSARGFELKVSSPLPRQTSHPLSALLLFVFSRRHQGHRLSINQDVHETPQHRVQAQAVHHVRHTLGFGRRDKCAVLRGTSSLVLVCLAKGQKGPAPCYPYTIHVIAVIRAFQCANNNHNNNNTSWLGHALALVFTHWFHCYFQGTFYTLRF